MSLLTGIPVATLVVANSLASQPAGLERYRNPTEVLATLASLHKAHSVRTHLHTLATSRGGTLLQAMEIGPEAGKAVHRMPAILVVANLEGSLPLATEGALNLVMRLLQTPELTRERTWYIVPNGNPDAAWRFFRKPLVEDGRNSSAWNDDMDDSVDEDGPDDLDGNGLITQMRVKDPQGEWMADSAIPRLLRRADAAKGEKEQYKLHQEGINNDGDGLFSEDPPGGVDIATSFPHLWRPFTATSGRWPGAEPESFALIQFAMERPEIAMTLTLGATNMCLQPPAGGRQGAFDSSAIRIPERLANRFGIDASRTYTMKEVIEMVRPMMPAGMEPTEAIVGSFLGLGPAVNPLEEDLKVYRELSDQYKAFLKVAKLDAKRLEPPQPKDGSFELWSYYHLGVPTFSMDFWTLPDAKAEDKVGITPESLEAMTPEAFLALGEPKISAFLKEVGAPETIKAAFLMEGVKSGRMSPKMMAGMLKSMPKPKEAGAVDPRQKALLAFSDKELGGKGFVPWTAFKHPQLGEVEIGGPVPFADSTPPVQMAQGLLDAQVPWMLKLSERLPRLRILKSEVEAKGADVYQVQVWVENSGYLPWPTAMGRKNKHVGPAVVRLEGKGLTFLTGRDRAAIQELDGGRVTKVQWLLRAPDGTRLDVKLESPNAGSDAGSVVLRAGGAK